MNKNQLVTAISFFVLSSINFNAFANDDQIIQIEHENTAGNFTPGYKSYILAGVGANWFRNSNLEKTTTASPSSVTGTDHYEPKAETALQIGLGHLWTKHWGTELDYMYTPRVTSTAGTDLDNSLLHEKSTYKASHWSVSLSGLGQYQLMSHLLVYGKLGIAYARINRQEESVVTINPNGASPTYTNDRPNNYQGIAAAEGLGIIVPFNKRFALRVGAEGITGSASSYGGIASLMLYF